MTVQVRTDYLAHWRYHKIEGEKLVYIGRAWREARQDNLYIFHSKYDRVSSHRFLNSFLRRFNRILDYVRSLENYDKIVIVCDEKEEKGCPRVYYANLFDNLLNLKIIEDEELAMLMRKLAIDIKEKVTDKYAFTFDNDMFYVKTDDTVGMYLLRERIYKVYDYGIDEKRLEDILLELLI